MFGTVFNIQRFSIDDGEGIRTTVFLKGCPLRCIWCHNPESWSSDTEIFFYPESCIGCGACIDACKNGCHIFDNIHIFDRTHCFACGKCADVCPTAALKRVGQSMTVEEVMDIVRRDKAYYSKDGGMTLSGGEPLFQWLFSASLAKTARNEGINVTVETCGYATTEAFNLIIPYVNCFLFDIKATTSYHKELTGVENGKILDNLSYLQENNSVVFLRCPIVPGCNDIEEHYEYIASLAKKHSCIKEIDLIPYHPLGITKSGQLGKPALYKNSEFLIKESLTPVQKKIENLSCIKTVII